MSSIVASALRVTASLWLAGGLVAFADPALASAGLETPRQAQVVVADLNLASPAGHATAERRIRAAAASVCATEEFTADTTCMDRAISGARQALDARTSRPALLAAN